MNDFLDGKPPMEKFVWILHCPKCHEGFSPEETDWDGPIRCRACGYQALIDHEADMCGGVWLEVNTDDPKQLADLHDDDLDQVYLASALEPEKLQKVLDEYQRRGRTPPSIHHA